MSSVPELTRDKDGFLKCKGCPRRFLTEIMFQNHSCNQHKKETEKKRNQKQHSQTIKSEISFPNHIKPEEECSLGYLFYGSQVDLKLQCIEHQKTSHHQYSECKKMINIANNLEMHLLNGHPLSSSQESK